MIEVGPLTEADHPRWTELWRDYLKFYDTTLPDAQFDRTWQRILAGQVLHALAAREHGTILGITHYLFHESGWTMTPVCYLQDLFTVAEARGRGVGRALIEAVAAEAALHGSTRLYWLTQDHNHTARALYEKIARHSGFIRYEYPALFDNPVPAAPAPS